MFARTQQRTCEVTMDERAQDVQRSCLNYPPLSLPTYPSVPEELSNSPSTPTSSTSTRDSVTVDGTTDLDSCRIVEIDGQPIRVSGAGEMTEQGRQALAEVIQAAKARAATEIPTKTITQQELAAAVKDAMWDGSEVGPADLHAARSLANRTWRALGDRPLEPVNAWRGEPVDAVGAGGPVERVPSEAELAILAENAEKLAKWLDYQFEGPQVGNQVRRISSQLGEAVRVLQGQVERVRELAEGRADFKPFVPQGRMTTPVVHLSHLIAALDAGSVTE